MAAPDSQVVLKNVPSPKPQTAAKPLELETLKGHWKNVAGEYDLTFEGEGERKGRIEKGRLTIKGGPITMVFTPED